MRHILTLLFLTVTANVVVSADPIVLFRGTRQMDLSAGVTYLIDADHTLGPQDAYSRRETFRPLRGESVQIPRNGVMWVYLELVNESDTERWFLENQLNVEEMALYLPGEGDWRVRQHGGNRVPFADREIQTRRPTVALDLPEGTPVPVLLRVSDYQSSNVRLRVFSDRRFARYVQEDTFLLGLAFGSFAALILYNLLVFATARERIYLVYALYMVAFFFNQLAQERLFSQYIEPNQPYGFFWFVIFSAATAVFGVEFFRRFVDTPRTTPLLDRIARGVQLVSIAIGASAFVSAGPTSADLINIVALVAMAVILVVLVVRIIAGDRLALVCLAGSIIYLLGTTAEIMSALVQIQVTPFVVYGQLYGALAQVLFLGFALGRRTAETRDSLLAMQTSYRTDLEREITARTHDLEKMARQLHVQAVTDPLTGLHNRAELAKREPEFDTYLARRVNGACPYAVTVAYLDLDNFKFVNDTYGHGFGDELLKTTAHVLRENTRGYDLLFRLGGDEFAIVMPETEEHEAAIIVERIRAAFGAGGEANTGVSISAGIASSRGVPKTTLRQLIERADQALLRAKAGGKDRLISAETGA